MSGTRGRFVTALEILLPIIPGRHDFFRFFEDVYLGDGFPEFGVFLGEVDIHYLLLHATGASAVGVVQGAFILQEVFQLPPRAGDHLPDRGRIAS
jgi:hypothetical protein